ncbi:hypothetical protein APA_5339 [Pseudanabaena sp. lw0831]|uniref:low-complexity tail membrane protein n=1 Tax=Pseudanabaena sp. lw0831 TaxID=1357935 RepID=UPI0019163A3C|nr:low-complexity tail membrane protein [Pseudanabaena sp. lw0831]GBO52249.1 hypothetical protein APA_5339 [Pseudanabaena sp. lw0831]
MTSPHPPNPTSNISLGHNPFIWGNIALLAGVPWLLALSMAGLAVGDPVFPEWFEIFLLGFPAISLVAWVQWQQPISPFSLWIVSKPSESLSDRERQILTLVKQHSNGWYVTGWIATAVAIVMSAIFCKIYISAPLAQAIAPFPAGLRLFGILWAEIFFLLSNVLLQAGVSALRIKLTAESELNGLKPFNPEKIKSSFTSIGLPSPQLLKFFEEDTAIAQVSDEAPQGEVAEQPLDINEPKEAPDAEAIEPSNFIAEVAPEAVPEINALVEDTLFETEAIADKVEELIADPVEFVEDSEDIESLDSTDTISQPEIETIPHEGIFQETEELEPIEFFAAPKLEDLDIIDTSSEPEFEPETDTEVADVSLDNDFVEDVAELEIGAIGAEELVIEMISETEAGQFIEEIQTESSLDIETSQAVELEPAEIVEEIEVELFGDITDPTSEPEIEESATSENAAVLEVADVSLDEQFVDEGEELEISEIIAEESLIETISEPEIEQFIEEPRIEVTLNQEIVQENEELNPFELVEDEKSDIGAALDSTEGEANLDEVIAEEGDELEAFETPEEPELTFLEIPDASPEAKFEETEQDEANLELAITVQDEEFTEEDEELESLENIEDYEVEETSNTILTSDDRRSLDFLKKSRKTGGSQKKQGFGKSIKRDVVSSPEIIEPESAKATEPEAIPEAIADPTIEIESDIESDLGFPDPISEPEMIQKFDKEFDLEAIATPIEEDLEASEIKAQNFDDELDELIAFNAYVENILREYLEEKDEESKNAESSDEEIPEQVDPSIVFDPTIEAIAIAKESVEAFTENLPDVETQVSADIAEVLSNNEQAPQDPEYLVQELLVDKFLARIEELNVDKANKAAIEQTTENISNPNPEIDEFADLEALLDGKPKNPDTDDLSDRNA